MSEMDLPMPDDPGTTRNSGSDQPSWSGVAGVDDPEFVRIDDLYRQALQAMEAVEAGIDWTPARTEPPQTVERPAEGGPSETVSRRSDELRTSRSAVSPDDAESGSDRIPVTPRQIIEAALFVGGGPLTSKALGSLLRGEFDQGFVEAAVEELNAQYAGENRPYTVRFGEGGYRMTLRPEFERLQNRVYGLGPKEVKLSQEALEILAVVAYKQPITRREIEELGKPNAGNLLRQLLRRELIALQRDEEDPQTVSYQTTQRFLDLFGIGRLDELPQPEELSIK